MGVSIRFKNAAFDLPNASIYAEDKVLQYPSGVVGLFDTANVLSYPSQANPTVNSKYWLNRAPNPSVPKLLLGTQAPPVTPDVDTTTPTFANGGFLMASASNKRVTGIPADFNFINTSFLVTCWFIPNAAYFAKPGTQGIVGRWADFSQSSYYLYGDGTAGGMTAFLRYDANSFDTIGVPGMNLQSGKLVQLGMSVEFLSGTSLRLKSYLDGSKKAEQTFAKGALFNTSAASFCPLGATENAQTSNGILRRVFIENLSVSGRSPEARVAEDYAAVMG